jgi:dUTP pyrophosphatase
MTHLRVKKLTDEATLPSRANKDDAGLDLYSLEGGVVMPGEGKLFKTGIAIEIEPYFYGQVADRSSMAKKGFKVSGGVIDSSYRGDLGVVLRNISTTPLEVSKGDRIAQLIIIPIVLAIPYEVEELSDTARGNGGFGSTGR